MRKIEYKSMCIVIYIIVIMPCHASIGKLVSLVVDNPQNYTSAQEHSLSPPPLVPINTSSAKATTTTAAAAAVDGEEQTMLWQNIATLFVKCEQNESDIQDQKDVYGRLTRGTDDLYQELQDVKNDIAQIQCERDQNKHGEKKMRKYVAKKCEEVRETVSYGAYNADNEIFAYIDKVRAEFQAKTKTMEEEISRLQEKLDETENIYDSDYAMFVQRENDLMAKLESAVQQTECLNQRIKDHEGIIMSQLQQLRNYTDQRQYQTTGDLREEFTRAICREVEYESKETAKLVTRTKVETEQKIDLLMNQIQETENRLSVQFSTYEAERLIELNDKMTDLVTRSNEYHSARYFGLVDEFKTMKQSIGTVDAELSDVKETVEFLKDEVADTGNDVYDIKEDMTKFKDEVYREMDRDYYDLKDYVKRRFHRHEKQKHAVAAVAAVADDALQMIVTEYAAAEPTVPAPADPENNEHIIIIDADTFMSDDDDEEIQHT
jgi:chromosome segregation ATPase